MKLKADSLSEAYVKALTLCNAELSRRGMRIKHVADVLDISYDTASRFLSFKLINTRLLDMLVINLGMHIIAYLED